MREGTQLWSQTTWARAQVRLFVEQGNPLSISFNQQGPTQMRMCCPVETSHMHNLKPMAMLFVLLSEPGVSRLVPFTFQYTKAHYVKRPPTLV